METSEDLTAAEFLRRVLNSATERADLGDMRAALELLRRHRDEALSTGEVEALLEALPLAMRVADAEAKGVEEYLQSTANAVASTYFGPTYERARAELQTEELQRVRRRVKMHMQLSGGLAGALALIGTGFLVFSAIRDPESWVWIAGVSILGVGLYVSVFFFIMLARYSDIAGEIERLERRATVAAALPGGVPSSDATEGQYFTNLVQINVTNLSDYYALVKVHTNKSFRASLVAGGLGFVLIAAGLSIGFVHDQDQSISYLATASGVFVEFISGVFFYLYNRTVRQLKEYHDSLLEVQNILLSFKIVADSAPEHRSQLLEKILTFLLQRDAEGARSLTPEQ
jgi:hypothetical protein